MIKKLESLLEKMEGLGGEKEASQVRALIKWAEVAIPKKGTYNINGLILQYDATSPASILIKAVPSGSSFEKDKKVFQNEGDFGTLYKMIQSHPEALVKG